MMGHVDAAPGSLAARGPSPAAGSEPFIVLEYLDGRGRETLALNGQACVSK